MSPGWKNNLTLQRSPQKYNVKVSYMGPLVGKHIHLLLYHILCFYRMCTHVYQFIAISKYIKCVVVLQHMISVSGFEIYSTNLTINYLGFSEWIIKPLVTHRESYQQFWPSVPKTRASFLSTRTSGKVYLCFCLHSDCFDWMKLTECLLPGINSFKNNEIYSKLFCGCGPHCLMSQTS